MPLLMAGVRWAALRALERARENVAHGHPSLAASLHYQRASLSDWAWAEADRAIDAVRFDVTAAQLEPAARSHGTESAEGLRLAEDLRVARRNAALPWEDPEGLSHVQCVALLFIARELVKRLPMAPQQALFPGLSTERR